jgi:KipI family sensor histidine kinase inhibitor
VVTARLLPMGDRAILLEVAAIDDVLALRAGLEVSRPSGVLDIVPAARTVLVRIDPRVLPLTDARAWALAAAAAPPPQATPAGADVVLDIAYDGADLAETAAILGLSPAALAERHAAARWSVAFTGFAPGFGYLVSAEWPYDVPRLGTPRTRVPAGAVGLAAGYTGAYPRETPGGWRLIGTTSAHLFDPDAASPALLAPGTSVRFRAVREVVHPASPPRTGAPAGAGPANAGRAADPPASAGTPVPASDRAVRILEPGLLATLQDLGRPGAASLGVSTSGALDRAALRTANRLLGNPEESAGIEITMGGLRAASGTDLWFAVTGAWGRILLAGREVDPYEAHPWHAGEELQLDWFGHGARAYLAVRGGFDAPVTLSSRSTDLLAGLGPRPLRAGDAVWVRDDPPAPIPVAPVAPWGAPHDDELEIELAPGPRADWFAASAHRTLYESVWTASNDADRIGMRLDGPELERARGGELPSEGMVPGAIQVPPSGRPTILLADGPVTGGYPVIAVVTDAALDLLAQARPGTRIRFRHARPI